MAPPITANHNAGEPEDVVAEFSDPAEVTLGDRVSDECRRARLGAVGDQRQWLDFELPSPLANQRCQAAAPVEAAELELAAVGKHEPRAAQQVTDGGRDEDLARLATPRIRAAAWTAIPRTSSP